MLDKGAVVALPYGVEGFATPKHLVKEDGTTAKMDEKLNFKVIEFNKDSKRIILSHSRIHEDAAKTAAPAVESASEAAPKKAAKKAAVKEETPAMEKTTLGDIQSLSDLKDQMVAKATKKMIEKEEAKNAEEKPAKKATKKVAAKDEEEKPAKKTAAKKATKKDAE